MLTRDAVLRYLTTPRASFDGAGSHGRRHRPRRGDALRRASPRAARDERVVAAIVKADLVALVGTSNHDVVGLDIDATRHSEPLLAAWWRRRWATAGCTCRAGRSIRVRTGEGRCASSRAWVAREGERGDRGLPEHSWGSPVRFGNCREKRPRIFIFLDDSATGQPVRQIFQRAKIFPRWQFTTLGHTSRALRRSRVRGLSLPHATHMTATSSTIRALAHPRAAPRRLPRAKTSQTPNHQRDNRRDFM